MKHKFLVWLITLVIFIGLIIINVGAPKGIEGYLALIVGYAIISATAVNVIQSINSKK